MTNVRIIYQLKLMNIVDIINIGFKYINNVNNRHISYCNNISIWIRINKKYIKDKTKKIIINYKRYLNQRDIYVILRCIKCIIYIIPILYQLSNNDITMILCLCNNNQRLFSEQQNHCNNILLIKLIINYNYYSHEFMAKYIAQVCKNGNLNIIRCLHQSKQLSFNIDYIEICEMSMYYGYIQVST